MQSLIMGVIFDDCVWILKVRKDSPNIEDVWLQIKQFQKGSMTITVHVCAE